jgi:hypothetical protein
VNQLRAFWTSPVHEVENVDRGRRALRCFPPALRGVLGLGEVPDEAQDTGPYLIESYTLNSGRYIAITMKPTMPPTMTIMIGSRIEVSALTAAATWSS